MAEREGAVQSSWNIDGGNRTWNISIRSRKDQEHVIAAKVKEDDGELIFTDVQGAPKGFCCLADLQGYSVEPITTKPRIKYIASSQEDLNGPAADDLHSEIWNVLVRSKKDPHHIEAANFKKDHGRLIFTDHQGDLTGCFYLAEVESCLAAPARPVITMVSSPADEKGQW